MTSTDRTSRLPRASLFRAGLGLRCACAAALSGLLWLAILWATGS
ncbi:MAG TPA: hypothetical protein VGN94_02430 [Methylobacterium sp.]|nr:hypothetical protein [Methylobacterium sp.]